MYFLYQNYNTVQIFTFIHLLYLVVYFLVAGQFIFYQLCFSRVFKQTPARHFLDIRKIADPILQVRLSIIYYSSLAIGILFVAALILRRDPVATILPMSSFILLVIDVVLAKKYNIPLNTKIRETTNPTDEYAKQLQQSWLKWIGIRGVFVTAGFIILLTDAVIN